MALKRTYQVRFDWPNTETFANETDSCVRFQTRMGRNEEMGRVEPTTAVIVLENEDGRFTPDYAAGPLFGNLENERRVYIKGQKPSISYEDLFYGFITDIEPDSHSKRVTIRCQDWSYFLEKFPLNMGPLEDTATGDIIDAILDEVGFPTGATWRTLDTGQEVIPYWMARNINAWDAIQEVAEHELGGLFYFGPSGKAIFEDRHARASKAITHSFNNSIGNFVYRRRSNQVYAKAKIGLGGFEEGVAGSIVYAHSPLPLAVEPGELVGDSESGLNINYAQNVKDPITPAATTDYVANSAIDGTGTDRTSGMTLVSFDSFGGGAQLLLRNDNLSTVYMQRLNIRGTPLGLSADLRTVERTGTALGPIGKTYERQFRFLQNRETAGDYANYIVSHYSTPRPLITVTQAVGDGDTSSDRDTLQAVLYESRISNRYGLLDTAFPWRSNVDGDYFIEMIEHEIDLQGQGAHITRWTLTDFQADQVWILGTSMLDTETILGY